jgi:hypothetical protein
MQPHERSDQGEHRHRSLQVDGGCAQLHACASLCVFANDADFETGGTLGDDPGCVPAAIAASSASKMGSRSPHRKQTRPSEAFLRPQAQGSWRSRFDGCCVPLQVLRCRPMLCCEMALPHFAQGTLTFAAERSWALLSCGLAEFGGSVIIPSYRQTPLAVLACRLASVHVSAAPSLCSATHFVM